MPARPPQTAYEVLAMVFCSSTALLGGEGVDPALLRPVKRAIIRRFVAARSRGARV